MMHFGISIDVTQKQLELKLTTKIIIKEMQKAGSELIATRDRIRHNNYATQTTTLRVVVSNKN